MASIEPNLTTRTKVMLKSELLGFPPVACLASQAESSDVKAIRGALLAMRADPDGKSVLSMLRLDGFAEESKDLYDPIAAKMRLVRSLTQ